MDMKGIEAQVQHNVDLFTPRFQALINTLEDEMDVNIQKTPMSIRLMTYEVILVDMLARVIAGGASAFNHPVDKALEGIITNLKRVTHEQFNAVEAAFPGGHNVHADSVGEELPPDKTER